MQVKYQKVICASSAALSANLPRMPKFDVTSDDGSFTDIVPCVHHAKMYTYSRDTTQD